MSISYFTQPSMDQLVKQQLAANPDAGTHTNAIIAGIDENGAHVAAHFVLDSNGKWTLSTDALATYNLATGDTTVGANVVFSW